MCAHPQTDIKGLLKGDAATAAPENSGSLPSPARSITTYLPRFTMRSRRGPDRFDWTSWVARPLRFAKLQRRQAIAMQGDVHVGGIGFEILSDQKTCLAVRISACADKGDVRRQRQIAGRLFPDIMKSISRRPHVLATGRERIALLRGVETH